MADQLRFDYLSCYGHPRLATPNIDRLAAMQQAARVSDRTAFFWLGKLVEYAPTERIFTNPAEKLTEDYVTGRFG